MKNRLVFLCTILLCLPVSAQDEFQKLPEVAPIPQPPKARLAKDIEAANRKWAERVFVQPFKARLKGESWNEAASAFVDHAVEYWADLNIATRRLGDLPKEGAEVLAMHCEDPLVLYFFSVIEFAETREWRHGQPEVDKALKIVADDKTYSRALAHFIARQIGTRAEKSGQHMNEIAAKTTAWIVEEWKDGSYVAGEESLFVHHEMGRWRHFFPEDSDKMKGAYESAPLPEWARRTLVAMLRSTQSRVWKDRNSGKQKPPEIAALGTEAYREFAEAWKLNPDEPWAAAEAVRFSHNANTASKEPTRRDWLDRAVSAEFDLSAPYRSFIDWLAGTYEPDAKLLAFGRACLETRRFDTIVPSFFRIAVTSLGDRREDVRHFYENPEIAKPLVVLCLAKLHEDSPTIWREWWASWLAVYAWLGGEPLHAEHALAELKAGLDPEALALLRRMQLDEAAMRGEIAIARAGATEDLASVRRLLDSGEYASAVARLETLAKKAGPASAPMLQRMRMAAEFEAEFAEGEWVRLKVPDHLDGWTVVSGKWDARDGVITCQGHDASAVLLAPGRVGRHFEIRGEVEIECKGNCCRAFGVTFAYVNPTFALGMSTDQRGAFEQTARVWGMTDRVAGDAPQLDSALLPKNHFYNKVDGQFLTMDLNGKKYFDHYELEQFEVPANGRFGFTLAKACAANSWRIRNVEVRRLPAQ